MNPYQNFVAGFGKLLAEGRKLPLGGFPPARIPQLPANAPRALIFSPHPDDEVIIGGLPLRLLRELKMNVINVAVTQGSNKARQPERWRELTACCQHVGFGLLSTRPNGLEGIKLESRANDRGQWGQSVARIAEILAAQQPRVIFFPHARDWNSSHIGTHHLVVDALTTLGASFSCYAVETEFWGAMDTPNLVVESSEEDVCDLLTALSFHVGEVRRNPYHVRLPAWLIDNVRRGAELVGGQGGASPDFSFATLYRLSEWKSGGLQPMSERGQFAGKSDDLTRLFPGMLQPPT
jgi:LmbE family N-acetylglucosaminyl deacetylase